MIPHAHTSGLHILTIVAVMLLSTALMRTVASLHPDNPFWQAVAYVA